MKYWFYMSIKGHGVFYAKAFNHYEAKQEALDRLEINPEDIVFCVRQEPINPPPALFGSCRSKRNRR